MMETYKIDPQGVRILRKKIQKLTLVIMLFVLIITFSSWFSVGNKAATLELIITAIIIIAVLSFNVYRAVKKQQQILESYQLTITSHAITREQATLPQLVIELQDIASITKNQKGVFIIQGKPYHKIVVPAQIENYEQLERSLNAIRPVETHVEKINPKLFWILIAIGAIFVVTAFMTLHTILLYLAVTLISGYFAWAFIYAVKSKMIPGFSKLRLIILIGAFACVYCMLMKKIYDEDQLKQFNFETGSENASHLLDSTQLNYPSDKNAILNAVGVKGNPETEWVIDLYRSDEKRFRQKELDSLFDEEWYEKFESDVYGYSTATKKWMFVFNGDSLETYDSVQVGVSLLNTYNLKDTTYGPELLDRYVTGLIARIKKFPELKFHTKEFSEIGFKRAQELVVLHNGFDKNVTIFLQADDDFPGIKVWDVLKSIGLNLNDDYKFEWSNTGMDIGTYSHFTVETSTKPGYFIPDLIRKGMNPKNLIFKFSIPKSVDAEHVFDIMVSAVLYSQKRLGGKLVNNYGEPFDIISERKAVVTCTEQLKKRGLQPGSEKALTIF